MHFLQKLDQKFGKYAIRHLTRYIIIAYIIGYIIQYVCANNGVYAQLYIGLDPSAILQGQVWRLVSWLLIPPGNLDVFTIIMLFCYYQLGTVLERVWGDFLYDFYIFFGIIMTIVGAFIMYGVSGGNVLISMYISLAFSTYYVSLSIFLGFAMTFPDQKMLLFYFIPIKIKYLALFDVAYLTYCLIVGTWWTRVQIICSLASTILFFFMTRRYSFRGGMNRQQKARAKQFQKAVSQGQANAGVRHKCAICGRTEKDDPNLEFRYCSRCNGNYEYCQDHLFTHTHVQ